LSKERVAVLGASPKSERYSNKAIKALEARGHQVFPVNPAYEEIDGKRVYQDLSSLPDKIDTLTIYVSPQKISGYMEEIIKLAPGRIIINPGTESEELSRELDKAGITHLEACTLVMLSTKQF